MKAPRIPDDEEIRLRELEKLESMFTGPEESLDRITGELVKIFKVPAAMINFIGRDVQFCKSCSGLPIETLGDRLTTREQSMCGHVVADNQMLVVEDLLADSRFQGNPMVEKKGLRFYAGTPLRVDGHAVGALSFVDTVPRQISEREKDLLKLIAEGVMSEINLRKASKHLLARTQLMERDLASARNAQRFLLPPARQDGNGYVVCHWYHPFDAIGGDFVDVLARHDGSVVVLLADVSGHGASAALTSAMTKTVFQRAGHHIKKPHEMLNALHRDLGKVVEGGRFMTAIAAIFDPTTSSALIASAGHPYPISIHNDSATIVKTPNEPPLLVEPNWVYSNELSFPMETGDRLLLYTDGATEAADPAGRMLDFDGLTQVVQKNARHGNDLFLPELFREIRQYAHGNLKDDVALVCLERSRSQ